MMTILCTALCTGLSHGNEGCVHDASPYDPMLPTQCGSLHIQQGCGVDSKKLSTPKPLHSQAKNHKTFISTGTLKQIGLQPQVAYDATMLQCSFVGSADSHGG